MAKPPKTPPPDEPRPAQEKSGELRREEKDPIEKVQEIEEDEKGLPPGSKTPWN